VVTEPQRRLGRGLDALLSPPPGGTDMPQEGPEVRRRSLPVAMIERNPRNPRRTFRPEEIEELAASLKQHGLVQPIVVRPIRGGAERYEIIAGERRWRAAQSAGLHEIPVTILDVSDRQALELAIVENVQRTDLNPIEEARGYQALIEEFGYSQGDLGATLGKSRVHVTNTLRLLRLPEAVLDMLEAGTLSAGHGRALLAAAEPEKLARQIAEKNLSVREAEKLTQPSLEAPRDAGRRPPPKDANLRALEKELTDYMGLRVEIRPGYEGRGELLINYRSLDQLDLICRKLKA
jgi:ParB family chromosome partitioning protein